MTLRSVRNLPNLRNLRLAQVVYLALGVAAAACRVAYAADEALGPDTGIQWDLTPAQVSDACQRGLADARAAIQRIDAAAAAPLSFTDGLAAIESTLADLNDALIAPSELKDFAVAKDVRDASSKCTEEVSAFGVQVAADPAIYRLAQAAAVQATNAEDRQLAEQYIEEGRRAGAGLDAATRTRVTALFDQLNNLRIAFRRALGDDHSTIEISREDAASLPPALASTLTPGKQGLVLAVNESTVSPFMKNEASAAARKRYRFSYGRRGGAANVQRLARAVALRRQIAQLLGFDTWAAYQMDAKMAKTPQRARALVDEVDRALLPKAHAEVAVLAGLKRAAGDPAPFAAWDYPYYEQQYEKAHYAVDQELIRQYFPVDKVVPAVLEIYAKLLGVRFEPLAPALAWAPDVTEYSIHDAASGGAIGWIFLDLYPRDGKYGHFASFGLRPGRILADGGYRRPVAAIIGNWPTPQPGKPALLSHADVITFFHEFGHLMHQTLSTARYASLFGTSVRRDFVEAPSQMLENWMWQPSVLKRVSSRVGSGEPLPDELIAKMIAAKHAADGYFWTTQAFYASYDLQLHTERGSVDPTALWFALQPRLTVFGAMPGTFPEAGFGHLMGGYDVGYYGYLWSRVYAQDMFSVFLNAGLDDPGIGMRYRKEILEPGGTAEPDQLLQRFLGRAVSYEPFYEDLGLPGK